MIYYFSATGNSQHVATRIAEALGTQAQSIETASTEIRLADREPLGFVTPTNWNELPVLVREFIQKADILWHKTTTCSRSLRMASCKALSARMHAVN